MPTIVVVPVGGGGLLSGVAAAIKLSRPDVHVVGVEPAGAAKMTASLAAGHPVTLDATDTIADGLMPVRPGDLTFEHVKAFVDQVVTVDDERIARAALWLFHEAKQVVEPSGAATVAATLWPDADGLLADRSNGRRDSQRRECRARDAGATAVSGLFQITSTVVDLIRF